MIAVYIICGIIAFFAALLLQSLVFTLDYGDDLTVYMRFLFIKIKLIPHNKKEKKKKGKKKSSGKAKSTDVKKKVDKSLNIKGFADTFIEFKSAIRPIIEALGSFIKHIRIKPLKIRAVLAGKDAAELALDYGRLCAVFYPALAELCEQMKIEHKNIYIGVDYVKPKFELEIFMKLRIRLCYVIALLLKALWQLVKVKLRDINNQNNQNVKNQTNNINKTERT
ncbi:MAG: hypothetical protein ACI396_05685 [Acutalibacteraceae bacterium]